MGDNGGGRDILPMRQLVLKNLFRLFTFNLQGDCDFLDSNVKVRISCVINFYGRLDLLSGILHSLVSQDYPKNSFEVILVEDRGGTDAGREMLSQFNHLINIVYLPLDKNFGKMGYSRNFGLARTSGDIVLFLDDDTVILHTNFLVELDRLFTTNVDTDAVVPHGHASFACIPDRYDYHDSWFMTSRCTAYRRSALCDLGGFMDHFVGQEDVEFVTRFIASGKNSINSDTLHYFHPPLLVPNLRKPKAVGYSFYLLKRRYPLFIWLLLILNCARHAPLFLLPVRKFREQGRFALGFLAGVIEGVRGGGAQSYS